MNGFAASRPIASLLTLMALFSKKGKDAAAASPSGAGALPTAPAAPGTQSTEDFSDFSEAAMADAAANGDADTGKGKKKGRAPKADKPPRPAKPKGLKGGSVVGLNIGNDSIKAIEIRGKGDSVVVTAMGMIPTPAESISNGVVMSSAALSRAIRDLFKQSGIKTRRVVTSVAGTGSLIVRIIEVPVMNDKDLQANMTVDLDRYIPFPPSEVVMDFKALRELPTDPDAANMEVLLAAAQREIVDSHIKVMSEARLQPQAIDVEPLAAARSQAFNTANGDGSDYSDVSALINIGATGSEISVLRGDIMVFTRSIPSGGNVLTQALADNLGLAWADAERTKREMGDALTHAGYAANGANGGFAGAGYNAGYGAPALAAGATGAAVVDDWSNFDAYAATPDVEVISTAPASAQGGAPDDIQVVSGAGAATDDAPAADGDPFDMNFFEQGPRTDEPEEQHRQKDDSGDEGEKAADPFDFSGFDFSDAADDEPATAASSATAAGSATGEPPGTASGAPAFQFDAVDEPAVPASPSASPGTPAGMDFQFDLDEAETPPATSASPVSDEADAAPAALELPQESAATLPSAYAVDTPPVASATPFTQDAPFAGDAADDFDLESLAAPAAVGTAATGTAAAGTAVGVAAATPTADTPVETVPPGAMPASPAADDFGMDDFGLGLGGATPAGISPETVHTILQPLLDDLVAEVRRSLEYYASRYPDAAVRRITLVGGGAKLKNLDALFTQSLGIPTTTSNPLARVTMRAPQLPPDYADQNGPIFAVSLGLALRDVV